MALSADDARDIADGFLDAARAIDSYLDANWETISRAEYETLNESARTLLRVSGFMTVVAVGLSIDQMADDSAELKKVIDDAKNSLAQLQAIGQAIRVAAGLVDLATAIIAKDPGAAFKASRNLFEVLQQAAG